MKNINFIDKSGSVLVTVIIMMLTTTIFIMAAVSIINLNLGNVVRNERSTQALGIAEAGINYYMWHLNHSPQDLRDGNCIGATMTSNGYGPCVHNFIDSDSKVTGTYTLYIKQPILGSSRITVRSIGKTNSGNVTRTIDADIAAPSFASYAIAANTDIWFGSSEDANGKVHSNIGIRMEGNGNDTISASGTTTSPPGYYYPVQGGSYPYDTRKPAIWGSCGNSCPSRAWWKFPVPQLSFTSMTGNFCDLKKAAFDNQNDNANTALLSSVDPCKSIGVYTSSYIPPFSSTYSGKTGYLITLKDNQYKIDKVTNERYTGPTIENYTTLLTTTPYQGYKDIPDKGVIYVEDNVWVRSDSAKFGGRVNIVSANLATEVTDGPNIIIVDDLSYKDHSGNYVIGLSAQGSVDPAPYGPADHFTNLLNFHFDIDAAIIAQKGCVWAPVNYPSKACTKRIYKDCFPWGYGDPAYSYHPSTLPTYLNDDSLRFYGSIAVGGAEWTWSNPCLIGSGFVNNKTTYDTHLLYSPPPLFPITSTFQIQNWREILVTP